MYWTTPANWPSDGVATASDLNTPRTPDKFTFRDYRSRMIERQVARPNRAARRKFLHDIKPLIKRAR